VNLAHAIAVAHEKNEAGLANLIAAPKPELQSDALVCVRRFADWAKSKGVPFLPAQPSTVAAYIRFENKNGANFQRIFETVRAIEQLHDTGALSNPCATMAVRHELGCIYHIDAPRSWPKTDRPLFNSLPIEVRAVIERRSEQDSKVLRRLQNEAAELRKQLNTSNLKGTENVTTDQKTAQ
jgi:hypothetical protein